MAATIDRDKFPWDWIGFQGVGQVPMTESQIEWLAARNMSRGEYMALLAEHKRELGIEDKPEPRSDFSWRR